MRKLIPQNVKKKSRMWRERPLFALRMIKRDWWACILLYLRIKG